MKKYVQNLSLKNKIFISCVSTIVIITIFLSIFLHQYVVNQTTETFTENSANTLIQASKYIDEKFRSILGRVNAMRQNTSFDKTLKDYLLNSKSEIYGNIALSEFSNSFIEIRSSDSFIESVFMHTPKKDFYDFSRPLNYGASIKDTELYNKVQEVPSILYWGTRGTNEIYKTNHYVIPIVFRFTVEGYNGDVLLGINLDESDITSYLEDVQSNDSSITVIIDDKGEEIVSSPNSVIKALKNDHSLMNKILESPSGNSKVKYDGKRYLVTYESTKIAPWKIINIKSESVLIDKLDKFQLFSFILTLLSIGFCFIFSWLISKTMVKPLVKLESVMESATNRDFSIRFNYEYNNEIGKLGHSFNYMVDEIGKLVKELETSVNQLKEEKEKVRIEQLLKRRAELKALQAQINPHFLYNTLDSINWKANEIQAYEISKMTTALATLFRTGLSRGHELIPLKDEILHISSYLTIQKMRYGDKFDYSIFVEDDLLELFVVKLILQPLIENAIYHGIKQKEGIGLIEIIISKVEQEIHIQVTDDGMGIHPLKLQLINKRLRDNVVVDKDGYGIYNVNERIHLYFGMHYGLTIQSEQGKGTTALLILPTITREEVEEYVHYFGRG